MMKTMPTFVPHARTGQKTAAVAVAMGLMMLSGCRHTVTPTTASASPPPAVRAPAHSMASVALDDTSGPPVYTETGTASWYGPGFHKHAAADGTIFDQDAMTAAHRTLPLGSTVRVTNLVTGQQTVVRITDRGPFVPGRVLDLSMGAAKEIGLYRAGIAKVRVEAFAHVSGDPAGRWAVQTGAFKTQQDASDLKAALEDRYATAKVISFASPTGFWVRIDPAGHAKAEALKMQAWIGAPDAVSQAYLVRLD